MKNLVLCSTHFLAVTLACQADLQPLEFLHPPDEAKPKTWIHVMDSNASKAGMEKDLKAMADVGIGGAIAFSVSQEMPYGDVKFNSPEFRDVLVHAAKVAEELGLEFGLHNCDGWSASGGPWVPVEESMKQLVWSETIVAGGAIDAELSEPRKRDGFYRDLAVIAYPSTQAEFDFQHTPRRVTSSAGEKEAAKLIDDELSTTLDLPMNSQNQRKGWVLFEFEKPVKLRSAMMEHHHSGASVKLYASSDKKQFELITDFPVSYRPGKQTFAIDDSFPEVEARYFKFELVSKRDRVLSISRIELRPFTCLPHWQAQAGYSQLNGQLISEIRRSPMKHADFIEEGKVVTLEPGALKENQLNTTLPDGFWRVMRFGFTTRGETNYPATPEGTGYETDKLDPEALEKHFAAYVGKVVEESGDLAGQSLVYGMIDSFEMGWQTWTRGLDRQFAETCGYELIPYLPLLAGRAVADAETTDTVLSDYRNLVTDLMTRNYYRRFTELCHEHGLKSYVQIYGNGPVNELQVGGATDVPMGEFWVSRVCIARPAVHAAHVYGKPVVAAEAFTAWTDGWKGHPGLMKDYGDHAWAQGINEFVFHRFAHQANTHVAPGMTMGGIGSHIDRTQTWWHNAGKAWMNYIQRGSHLLRQGVPVSDVLVFVGDRKASIASTTTSVRLPPGFNLDSCQSDVLFHRVSVKDGKLVLPEGTSYEVLFLKSCDKLHYRTLQRLGELAEAGATIIGNKPQRPIGYLEWKENRAAFEELATRLWGDGTKENRVGKGRIIPGSYLPKSFDFLDLEPDLVIDEIPEAKFTHRKVAGDDLYFVHHREDSATRLHCSFRIEGQIPELWHPDTGRIERLAQFVQKDGRTDLTLELAPKGSVFVVFRQPTGELDPVVAVSPPSGRVILDERHHLRLLASEPGTHRIEFASGRISDVEVESVEAPIVLESHPWDVEFDGPGLTGPKLVTFDTLIDWTDHPRDDIKHFSGTAHYRTKLQVPPPWLEGEKRIHLDLGQLNIAAEVVVNGKHAGTLWKKPFRLDVTDQLVAGNNRLEIRVTNLWTNRLIGDESLEDTSGYAYRKYQTEGPMPQWYRDNQPMPEGPRSTFTTNNFYRRDRTLLPSGLIGPVSLEQEVISRLPE